MSETNRNTPTSASMRGGACSSRAEGGGGRDGRDLSGVPGLTHGDMWEAVNAANRDEAEKTYGEDGVRVLRVVSPGAPRFDSSGVSHGDSACIPTVGGHDSHGCRGVVGDRATQPAGDTGGTADRGSCGMPGGRVERGAVTAVPVPNIDITHERADNRSGGRCDSGGAGTDENMCGRAGRGDGSAVIDADLSPQHPTRRIPDAGVLLFDVPVVLERRYVTTPPNGDEETGGFSSAGSATGVDVSVGEEAGAPLLGKSRKYVSSSNTSGDACVDDKGGADGVDGDGGHCRVSGIGKYGDCRG